MSGRVHFEWLLEDRRTARTVSARISLSQSSRLSRPHNGTYNMGDCGKIGTKIFMEGNIRGKDFSQGKNVLFLLRYYLRIFYNSVIHLVYYFKDVSRMRKI